MANIIVAESGGLAKGYVPIAVYLDGTPAGDARLFKLTIDEAKELAEDILADIRRSDPSLADDSEPSILRITPEGWR
jgi:hypothetical protein